MAGKLVFNIKKNRGNFGALGAHIDRTEGMEHMYSNADPSRKHLNRKIIATEHCKLPLYEAINSRIAEGYKGKRKLRSDAVKSLGIVLTGSHEQMKKIFKNKKALKHWLNQSFDFLIEEFGQENIVRLDLHMDERTPHLHAVVVPLTSDGRLSAREVIGNKSNIKRLRKVYAQKLTKLHLGYGVEKKPKTATLSTKISDFYNLVENYDQEFQNKIKTLKTADFDKLNSSDKTKMLKELAEVARVQELNSAIFEKYLKNNTKNRGLKR